MIFVWSSDGGPLQYVGIALFIVQFLPLFLGQLDVSISPDAQKQVAYRVLLLTVFLVSFFAFRARRAGVTLAQARDAVANGAREAYGRAAGAVRDFFGNANGGTGGDGKIIALLLAMVFVLSALALAFGPAVLLTLLHLMPLGIFILSLRRATAGAGAGGGGGRGRGRPNSNDLSDIVNIVAGLPVEEYVPEGGLDKCTVSQLKEMLKIRQPCDGESGGTDNFVERKDLVEAVRKRRKASDSCCICCEDYQTGDPLRVLPKCQHEFHLECIDQWSYTFATSRDRRSRDPSCPLCNAALS